MNTHSWLSSAFLLIEDLKKNGDETKNRTYLNYGENNS